MIGLHPLKQLGNGGIEFGSVVQQAGLPPNSLSTGILPGECAAEAVYGLMLRREISRSSCQPPRWSAARTCCQVPGDLLVLAVRPGPLRRLQGRSTTRARISAAALRVKVMARTCSGRATRDSSRR